MVLWEHAYIHQFYIHGQWINLHKNLIRFFLFAQIIAENLFAIDFFLFALGISGSIEHFQGRQNELS